MVNFAEQQPQGGGMNILYADDLIANNKQPQVYGYRYNDWGKGNCCYIESPNFSNRQCNKMNNKKNASGDYGYGGDGYGTPKKTTLGSIFDTVKWGAGLWSQQQKSKADAAQAQSAAEIARINLLTAQQQAASAAAAGTGASKIKAYTVPILVTGIVVIGAIAAYFVFKKKNK